jgi:hypothetical protein
MTNRTAKAVRRWLAAHGGQYRRLRPVYLGDDLFSRQPICEAVLQTGGHFSPAIAPVIWRTGLGVRRDANW